MSQKIQITPLMELSASVTLINDRNASTALVHLFNEETGEVIGHATGASKREQGDIYREPVAVKLAAGRALQKMARQMISEANKEVRTAMAEAEAKAVQKAEDGMDEWYKSHRATDYAYNDMRDFLGLPSSRAVSAEDTVEAHSPDGENLNGDAVPTTADGTPVTELPESLRRTLADLGIYPHEVQIIDLDQL